MRKARVLIVDDDPGCLNTLEYILNGQGYEITATLSSFEALNKITEHDYDMLITNLVMPELTGFQLLEKIKRLKKSLVSIMVTGQLSIHTLKDAIELGCFAYIKKPFDAERVKAIVKKAFNTQRLPGTILLAVSESAKK